MTAENIENGIRFPPFTIPLKTFRVEAPRGAVAVAPAMGTAAGFYAPFAEQLAALGYSVILPELPGTGLSRPRPSWKVDYAYRDLVETWLPQLLDTARQTAPGAPVVLIGHSLGAHVGAMALLGGGLQADALVTVAGGNIHFRNWHGAAAVKIRLGGALFAGMTRLFGHLPGQYVGFGGPQARSLIREWSNVIRTGRFPLGKPDSAPPAAPPAFCIAIEGDNLAPQRSVTELAGMLGGETETLAAPGKGHPHSAWARAPEETAGRVDRWLTGLGIVPV